MSPNSLEAPTSSHNVETAHSHVFYVCHSREPEADHNDKIAEKENGTLEVIALPFAVHVAEKENAQNNSDHIPLWENKAESMINEIFLIEPLSINGAEQYQSRNLKQANLEGIRRPDLHR